jgi:hypothetical protein
MQSQMSSDIVMNALLMAVWRRQPNPGVMIHSDQGSQWLGTCRDFTFFFKDTHSINIPLHVFQ